MAFKIKAPFHIEGSGSTVNPGKKINLTKEDSPDFAKSEVGSKVISYQQYRDSGGVPKGMENVFSGKGTLRVSKSYTGKKSSGQGEGTGQGSGSSIKGTSADTRTYDPFSKKTNVKKEKPKREPRNRVTAINTPEQISVKRGDYGKGVETKKGVAKGLDVETPKISTKKPTVKIAPKDNSRKAIKKRKTADKAAGVSKSQMRANKAKSKSEAALAKAKKSKNPDYRAQLKRKSDRLAKRAERKGGSPVKATGDPKNPKTEKKQHYPGYKPLGDAEKMKGNSAEAQALNTINTRAQNKIKSEHKKKDLSLKFPTKGQRIGRKGYEIVGSDSTSGNVYVRKRGKLPVMEITRKNLASNIKSKGMVKLNYQKMKHGYDSAGDIIKRK